MSKHHPCCCSQRNLDSNPSVQMVINEDTRAKLIIPPGVTQINVYVWGGGGASVNGGGGGGALGQWLLYVRPGKFFFYTAIIGSGGTGDGGTTIMSLSRCGRGI